MASVSTPVVAIVMGDPSGVGPELVVKAFDQASANDLPPMIAVGVPDVLRAAAELVGSDLRVQEVASVSEAAGHDGALNVIKVDGFVADDYRSPSVHAGHGRLCLDAMRTVAALLSQGEVQALVTAPCNKEAMRLGGMSEADEYEFVGNILGEADFSLASVLDGLWVFRVTSHVPFASIPSLLSVDEVQRVISLAERTVRAVTGNSPRIGVAALNPQAGEGGSYGLEEIEVIGPAIEAATRSGVTCVGPVPADTIFTRATRGEFDVVVAMYHDQANIALKVLGFGRGVTVGAGLPYPFATPAHGTAFDIAWTNRAEPRGLINAVKLAGSLAAA